MAKYKVGQLVQHVCTGDKLLILHVKSEESYGKAIEPSYVVRLPNYQKAEISEFELEGVKTGSKIEG